MPIYEYRCGACGHHLEALQKMSDGPLRKCPDCGRSQLKRLVSASRFRLKGGGWYETDFKNKRETQRNLVGRDSSEAAEEFGQVELAGVAGHPLAMPYEQDLPILVVRDFHADLRAAWKEGKHYQ